MVFEAYWIVLEIEPYNVILHTYPLLTVPIALFSLFSSAGIEHSLPTLESY
jgi:hypothetical protein